MSNIEQKTITRALVNPSFQEISDYFGYDSKNMFQKLNLVLRHTHNLLRRSEYS